MSLVGVSLKMYLGVEDTRRWLRAVAALSSATPQPELFVLPSFVSLADARDLLAGTAVRYGAQDVFWEPRGPFTGEISAPMLAELGCSYAEVGHAERRRLFGEDDAITGDKARAAARAGLVPVVCIGETERLSADRAARACRDQIEPVLDAVGPDADVVLAYEPVWAIGADVPAPPEHVRKVVRELRGAVAGRPGRTPLLYGGSAGPGLFAALAGCVDGLFLGRFAHDIDNLRTVVAEVASAPTNRPAPAVGRGDAMSAGRAHERRKPAVAGFGHQEIGRMVWRGDVRKKVSALWLPSLPDTPHIGGARRSL